MSDQTIPHITIEGDSAVLYVKRESEETGNVYYDLLTLLNMYSRGVIAAHEAAHASGRLDHQHQVEGARQLLLKMQEDLDTLTLLAEFSIPDDLSGEQE